MSTQTTKKKMEFDEYIKSYLALCEHFENISKGIDFELLKKVDIFNDGNNTQGEIDEIRKILKSLSDEKTFFNNEIKNYEAIYEKPDDWKPKEYECPVCGGILTNDDLLED